MLEKVVLEDVLCPDCRYKIKMPAGWVVRDDPDKTPGALQNRIWSSPADFGALVSFVLTVYPANEKPQEGIFNDHLAAYERDEDVDVLDYGHALELESKPHFIRVLYRQSALTAEGAIYFYAIEGQCFILQCLGPPGSWEGVRPLFERVAGSFEYFDRRGFAVPPRPSEGTIDAYGGFIGATFPIRAGGREIPAIAFIHPGHGIGVAVPRDSVWGFDESKEPWSVLVELPGEIEGRHAVLNIQVLPGSAATSSLMMDEIERLIARARGGTRVARASLLAPYGAVERLEMAHIQNGVQIKSKTYIHSRPDRSVFFEFLIPAGLPEETEEVIDVIADNLQVYDLGASASAAGGAEG
ncbi:MAG: hypothetical protein HRF49_09715 [bacterium]